MAYRKRSPKKTYKSKDKPATWRTYAGKALMGAGTAGLKGLKKALGLNTENKNWDTNPSGTCPNVLGAFNTISTNLAQGNTNQQRNGNGLRITHYKIRGYLQTVAPNYTFQRVRIIFTHQPKLSIPGSLVLPTQVLQNAANIDSPYNTDLEGVRIIFDKTFMITPYTTQLAQTPFKFKWSPGYDAGHIQWTDADVGGLDVNLVQGAVQMMVMTDQLANPPIFAAYARAHFVDN